MEALRPPSTLSPPSLTRPQSSKPLFTLPFTLQNRNSLFPSSIHFTKSKFKSFTAVSPSVSVQPPEEETETLGQDEKFEWFSEWYALMPVCDLDKRAPHGKKVMGLDVVVWWDKNENAWKVFDDRCPHRLAPLSEGRIDEWGRLQCVYHGWCFGGSGDCKFIPQAPRDGPPVHTSQKACVAVYPSTVQNGIVWFWPSTDPQYKDILTTKQPPYVPEIDDPSFTGQMFNRDIPYGYEVLIENLMDPAHVPYAHYGMMSTPQPSVKLDREGGRPLDINIRKIDKNGFVTTQPNGQWNFVAPCLFYGTLTMGRSPYNASVASTENTTERKVLEAGLSNWQKACFVPTKSDANVVAFRKWLKIYGGSQVDWANKFDGCPPLPPTPPREVLMDRYWSHVVNCSSCSTLYKGLNVIQVSLQVLSLASVIAVAATKQGTLSVAARNSLVAAAVLCFAGSKWLSRFIYKNYHYHDYNHKFR